MLQNSYSAKKSSRKDIRVSQLYEKSTRLNEKLAKTPLTVAIDLNEQKITEKKIQSMKNLDDVRNLKNILMAAKEANYTNINNNNTDIFADDES